MTPRTALGAEAPRLLGFVDLGVVPPIRGRRLQLELPEELITAVSDEGARGVELVLGLLPAGTDAIGRNGDSATITPPGDLDVG